jgi:acetyl-CoA carboxylase beta subunit
MPGDWVRSALRAAAKSAIYNNKIRKQEKIISQTRWHTRIDGRCRIHSAEEKKRKQQLRSRKHVQHRRAKDCAQKQIEKQKGQWHRSIPDSERTQGSGVMKCFPVSRKS